MHCIENFITNEYWAIAFLSHQQKSDVRNKWGVNLLRSKPVLEGKMHNLLLEFNFKIPSACKFLLW